MQDHFSLQNTNLNHGHGPRSTSIDLASFGQDGAAQELKFCGDPCRLPAASGQSVGLLALGDLHSAMNRSGPMEHHHIRSGRRLFGGANSNLFKAEYPRRFLESGHQTHMIQWILGKTMDLVSPTSQNRSGCWQLGQDLKIGILWWSMRFPTEQCGGDLISRCQTCMVKWCNFLELRNIGVRPKSYTDSPITCEFGIFLVVATKPKALVPQPLLCEQRFRGFWESICLARYLLYQMSQL